MISASFFLLNDCAIPYSEVWLEEDGVEIFKGRVEK
jgi:hypothetical protein